MLGMLRTRIPGFLGGVRRSISEVQPKTGRTKIFGRLFGATLGLGLIGAGGLASQDEGVKRSLRFWLNVFPIYLHYRVVQFQTDGKSEQDIDAAFDPLHEKYAPIIEGLALELRGFYLKQAQLISTLDDFVPGPYMDFCKRSQDQVPTEFGPGEARAIVERSLGRPIDEIFSYWDDKPRGAASIGQVHYAILRENGHEVAVKIQFPGIERRFRSDLFTVKTFCSFALPQHIQPLEEIEAQFLTEFDYALEAKNLMRCVSTPAHRRFEKFRRHWWVSPRVADNIMPQWKDKVEIPRPVEKYCTKDVLVMDYIHGVKLVDGIRNGYRDIAKAQGTTIEKLEEEQREAMKNGTFKFRTVEEDKKNTRMITLYTNIKDYYKNTLRFLYNMTLGWVFPRFQYEWSRTPVDLGNIIELLHAVHGHEIFLNGEFNGDPHPGNILLMNDGRIGLIDYGQVKHISLQTRIQYAKLIITVAKDDKEAMIDLLWNDIGSIGKNRREDIAYKLTCFWNDRDTKEILGDMNIVEFLDWCQAEDPVERINGEFVMPARVSVLLRGMGNAFGMKLRTSTYWEPYARQLLKEQGIEYLPEN